MIGDAEAIGIKYGTLRRAADELGVRKVRETGSTRWIWSLLESGETEIGEATDDFADFS